MANSITNNPITGYKDRSAETAPVSKYILFQGHEDTESDVTAIRDYGNASVFTSDVYDIGGSGHSFANGNILLNGDQDGLSDTTALREHLRLDTLAGVGGMLCMINMDVDVNPANNVGQIVWCGSTASSDPGGGWDVHLVSNGSLRMGYMPISGSLNLLAAISGTTPYEKTAAWYMDCYDATPRVYTYEDGVITGAGTDLTDGAAGLPSMRPTRVFSLGSKRLNDSAFTFELNSNSDVAYIADIWIIRFEYDALGDGTVAEVVDEHATNPRERILRSLAGK